MPTKSEAIKRFLESKTHDDLSNLYSLNMECQVNVAQDGGERTDGDYKGRKWHGWTDGLTTWKSFRIPYKANTEPEYDDGEMRFDLEAHAEGIGLTGWDWYNKESLWVAFDFDAIIGHSDKNKSKLTNAELNEIKDAAYNIPWVTIRKSTSGQGLHLYVFLEPVKTNNHCEHAALARAILGKMSASTGFDFDSKVDACGGNMWIWARKMTGTDGLSLIKQGKKLKNIPPNWRDHIKVVTGYRRKNLPHDIEKLGQGDLFEELSGQRPIINLDDEHKRLIEYLTEIDALWWWDQDHHMLVTHTIHLKEAHEALNLKGIFETLSTGKEHGKDHNCYAFPLRKGAWSVRRYTPGVQEHESWDQDGRGWTRCYYNREPDLATAARTFGGVEDPKGGFVFRESEQAIKAARYLGVNIKVATALLSREASLKQHKDGRLIIEVERKQTDTADEMSGWLAVNNRPWQKIFNVQATPPIEPEMGNYDDLIRHLITETGEDYGWKIKTEGKWRSEPLQHIRVALSSLGLANKEINNILGSSVFKCWRIINRPFQPEYPGDREWNIDSAQLRFLPSKNEQRRYPTWLKILQHCGSGLDEAIKTNPWAKANGIINGADYLKCWIASIIQQPLDLLPYLFLFGPQNSGKSIFHEALSLLITRGYKRADASLISQAGFNAELEGAIICVIEETDLRYRGSNNIAYNRIKDWVTSRELLIHAKGRTPYQIPNTTHWIHCSNDHQACPIFPGDTRITMSYVESLDPIDLIPKKKLITLLEKEAPDFVAELIHLEIPESNDRLNVPALTTEDKIISEELNKSPLDIFISEKCEYDEGRKIKFSDFYDKFIEWLPADEASKWRKRRVGRDIPPRFPKGRQRKDSQFYIGNIKWVGEEFITPSEGKYAVREEYLEIIDDS